MTFLLDSGAAVSVLHLDALASEFRNRITTTGLTAPIGANGSPLDVVGQIKMPVRIGTFETEQVFIVVTTLTVDCLLGADYLVTHGVIIDYKRGCVVIKDNEIPVILSNGVATTANYSDCDRTISALNNSTIPGCTVQLVDVSLPDELKSMALSNILIEPLAITNAPNHLLVARTLSPVFNGAQAVVQIMNLSPTTVTIYQGTKLREFTPQTELMLVESPQQQPNKLTTSTVPDVDLTQCSLSHEHQQDLLALTCLQLLMGHWDVLQWYNTLSIQKDSLFVSPCVVKLWPCKLLSTLKLTKCSNKMLFNQVPAHDLHPS